MTTNTITLILGGTGKTGSRVAKLLAERGAPVRVASRSGTPAFDWETPSTWGPALEGVGQIYLTYFPDLAAPGAAEVIGALAKLAASSGVRRIVLLSGRGEPQCHPAEDAVKASGVEWTILRGAWFAQNFSEGYLRPLPNGDLPFPGGTVSEPFVDIDDIAEVAALALTTDGHVGKTYELTGPRLLTFEAATGEIARASGKPVRYVPVSMDQYAEMLGAHVPAEYVAFLVDLFRFVLDGHNAHTSGDVERVLGRPARDFRMFAERAQASGAWDA